MNVPARCSVDVGCVLDATDVTEACLSQDGIFGCSTEALSQLTSRVLEHVCSQSAATKQDGSGIFGLKQAPISLDVYLARLTKFLPAKRDSLVLMLLYLRRIHAMPRDGSTAISPDALLHSARSLSARGSRKHPTVAVNAKTIHRLVFASLVIAGKFISDAYIPQERIAKCGGMDTKAVLSLEVEVLIQLEFSLLFTSIELDAIISLLDLYRTLPGDDVRLSSATQAVFAQDCQPVHKALLFGQANEPVFQLPPFITSPYEEQRVQEELERTPQLPRIEQMQLD